MIGVLEFESYHQMSDWIREHGPLSTDREVRIGPNIIVPERKR